MLDQLTAGQAVLTVPIHTYQLLRRLDREGKHAPHAGPFADNQTRSRGSREMSTRYGHAEDELPCSGFPQLDQPEGQTQEVQAKILERATGQREARPSWPKTLKK